MTISGNQLLSALGSGILPGSSDQGVGALQKHEEELDFNSVLRRIQDGRPSELDVRLGKGLDSESVSEHHRKEVGIAADRAALKGVDKALVDLGESFVRLDVRNRVIEAQFKPTDAEVFDQINGFVSMRPVDIESDEDEEINQSISAIPARIVRNQSLADVLSSITP